MVTIPDGIDLSDLSLALPSSLGFSNSVKISMRPVEICDVRMSLLSPSIVNNGDKLRVKIEKGLKWKEGNFYYLAVMNKEKEIYSQKVAPKFDGNSEIEIDIILYWLIKRMEEISTHIFPFFPSSDELRTWTSLLAGC